jgi:hypothetical protein
VAYAILAMLACTAARTGVLRVDDAGRVRLDPYAAGASTVLHLAEASRALEGAHGAIVEVRGARVPGHLWVRDWRVLDAGDGSGGFVGVLRPHGSRWLLDDRNTASTLLVDDLSAARMRAEGVRPGSTVLLSGHVVGGGIVTVVAYRVLLAPTEAP